MKKRVTNNEITLTTKQISFNLLALGRKRQFGSDGVRTVKSQLNHWNELGPKLADGPLKQLSLI